jgi:hypothetical protein
MQAVSCSSSQAALLAALRDRGAGSKEKRAPFTEFTDPRGFRMRSILKAFLRRTQRVQHNFDCFLQIELHFGYSRSLNFGLLGPASLSSIELY